LVAPSPFADLATEGKVNMCHNLTMATIVTVFTETVAEYSGRVADNYDDGSRLFVRALLPFVKDVRPNDSMQGGLALRATQSEIALHPYLFRKVCSNGQIMAQSLASFHVDYSRYGSEHEVIRSLQDAIRDCSQEDVFTASVGAIQTNFLDPIDLFLTMMPVASQVSNGISTMLLAQIMDRITSDPPSLDLASRMRSQTRFSIMNAVTSLARDTDDQEQRWRLEELGGAIGAGLTPAQPSDHGDAYARFEDVASAK
jgi:hypothetical protein